MGEWRKLYNEEFNVSIVFQISKLVTLVWSIKECSSNIYLDLKIHSNIVLSYKARPYFSEG